MVKSSLLKPKKRTLMITSNSSSYSKILLVNCAACHGILTWSESQGLVNESETKKTILNNKKEHTSQKTQTLSALAKWTYACLGVHSNKEAFRKGWQQTNYNPANTWHEELGYICRNSRKLLAEQQSINNPSDPAAMLRCYSQLLNNPDDLRTEGIDEHIDDRESDLKLSEAVYEHNFRTPLTEALHQIAGSHIDQSEPLVVLDVGAGGGGVLLDAGQILQKRDQHIILVAVDPSPIARKACRQRLEKLPSVDTQVIDGSIEDPMSIIKKLEELNIPLKRVILLAKAALHDRKLAESSAETHKIKHYVKEEKWNDENPNTVYRNEDWSLVGRDRVINDMVNVINNWHKLLPNAAFVLMESHLVSPAIVKAHLKTVPLLPAYLAHALSCQYLLTANDHFGALKATKIPIKSFKTMQKLATNQPLMSLAILSR